MLAFDAQSRTGTDSRAGEPPGTRDLGANRICVARPLSARVRQLTPQAHRKRGKKLRNRKILFPATLAAIFALFGMLGASSAIATSPSASSNGMITAQKVLDSIVEVSGATTQRGITPKSVYIDRKGLKITSSACADPNDWLSYYAGASRAGSTVTGVVGGTLCSGEKVFRTDPEYLPETYKIWEMMANAIEKAFPLSNKYLYGLLISSPAKSAYSNGSVATLRFTRPSHSGRSHKSLRKVKLFGSSSSYFWLFRPR